MKKKLQEFVPFASCSKEQATSDEYFSNLFLET